MAFKEPTSFLSRMMSWLSVVRMMRRETRKKMTGKVKYTVCRGRIVYEDKTE